MSTNVRKLLVIVLFLLSLALVVLIFAQVNKKKYLEVSFLDVGQGDAIFIETPSGFQVLIDGGPDRSLLSELALVMPFWDRSINIIIATHPDKDHIAGLIDVLSRYKVNVVVDNGRISETAVYASFAILESEEEALELVAERGQTFELDEDVVLEILSPVTGRGYKDDNATSVIVKLSYADTCFILTGDAGKDIERELIALYKGSLDCQVLKLGHHGSRTSSAVEFLQTVSPEVVVISAGEDNRYGHPHTEVLQTLTQLGIPSLVTFESGTIRFISDGTKISIK